MTMMCMLDKETLGTGTSAAVLQIGVCAFDPASPLGWRSQQWTVNLASSLALGGEIDAETFYWWMEQSDEARRSVTGRDGSKLHDIREALEGVIEFYKTTGCTRIWSHGATFDIPILGGYYRRAGLKEPWAYYGARDTRTIIEAAELKGWVRPQVKTAHTAARDAEVQAVQMTQALRVLGLSNMGSGRG